KTDEYYYQYKGRNKEDKIGKTHFLDSLHSDKVKTWKKFPKFNSLYSHMKPWNPKKINFI
ncbi:MAG: hypothetical protein CL527_04705, partial [Aequorivita sp.]|nr:hypothetical protein [Aequorivita sp.]